LAKY